MNQSFLRSAAILGTSLIIPAVVAQTNIFPATGNVGIGTASPGFKLEVVGSFRAADSATLGDAHWATEGLSYAALSTFGGVVVRGNSINVGQFTIGAWSQSAPSNGLFVGGNSIFSGNVGIGTASPLSRLQVSAPDTGTWATMILDGSRNNNANTLLFRNSYWSTASDAYGYAYIRGLDTGTQGGSLVFATTTNSSGTTGVPSERLRITAFGNVGIGTQTPESILAVSQTVNGQVQIQIRNGSTSPSTNPSTAISFRGWRDVVPNQENARIESVYADGGDNNNLSTRGDLRFSTTTRYNILTEKMRVTSDGNVGIGTTNPTNKLEVNGTIRAKEVIVETTGWSDYVFAPDYRLAPLSEVEAHIAAKGTLPGIPSAAEVAAQGVSVGDMQAKFLAKVEELTLHQIEMSKQLSALVRENAQLKREIAAFRSEHTN